MNLLLISDTKMVINIFTLICKRLDLKIFVKNSYEIDEKKDFIIVDEKFINDKFNTLKKKCLKLGAICSDELPFDKSRDFIIQRPFLPMELHDIIKEQVKFLDEEKKSEEQNSNVKSHKNTDELLADDIALDIENDNDESIISLASLDEGGVLDNMELSKISDILRYDNIQNEVMVDENDWKELSDIIDDALNEVNASHLNFPFDDNRVKLILNKYNVNELKPLLEKFDQSIIEKLLNGEEIELKLSLKE